MPELGFSGSELADTYGLTASGSFDGAGGVVPGVPDPAAMPVRPGVMIYHSILPQLERLSDCERGQLFLALMQYSIRGRCDPIDFAPDLVLQGLIPLIDRDRAKYMTICAARRRAARIKWERAEAEKEGAGAP